MKKFLSACFLALLLAVPAAAQAERIRSSDSRFTVNTDGSMQVVEKIVVEFAGINIVHGIYRDFPTLPPLRDPLLVPVAVVRRAAVVLAEVEAASKPCRRKLGILAEDMNDGCSIMSKRGAFLSAPALI